MTRTLALVGAAGGVGTTRAAVECAAMLARDGRDIAVLDAAYATQGLSEYVRGRVDPDLTACCLDADRRLDDAFVDLDLPTPGRVALAAARAPFERLARAKAVEAARGLEERIAEAAREFDAVLVDVPPVAANQAIAAVTAVDRVAIVAPGGARGADARRRMADRLRDVGAPADRTVAVGGPLEAADAVLPRTTATPTEGPACLGTDAYAAGVADAVEALFDASLGVDMADEGVLDRVRSGVEELRG